MCAIFDTIIILIVNPSDKNNEVAIVAIGPVAPYTTRLLGASHLLFP